MERTKPGKKDRASQGWGVGVGGLGWGDIPFTFQQGLTQASSQEPRLEASGETGGRRKKSHTVLLLQVLETSSLLL